VSRGARYKKGNFGCPDSSHTTIGKDSVDDVSDVDQPAPQGNNVSMSNISNVPDPTSRATDAPPLVTPNQVHADGRESSRRAMMSDAQFPLSKD
jgi:hypothetical protein